MLFPGHERSQRLLEDLANGGDRSRVQEHATVGQCNHATEPLKLDFLLGSKQSKASTKPSIKDQNHNLKAAAAQARTKPEHQWPNGTPPTGPRKSLKWAGQYPPRRQSTTVERGQKPVVDGTSFKGTVRRPSLSQAYENGTHGLATTKPVDEAACGTSMALEGLQRANSSMHDSGHVTKPDGYETIERVSQSTTKLELIEQIDGNCDKHLQINVEVSEYSPPEMVTLLTPADVPSMPSSDPQTSHGNGIGPATSRPTYSVNKTDAPYTSSLGVRHKDIALVVKQLLRSSSETASVISATSSNAGKSSLSSVSSSMRLSICHICKKPPFREKLKGCSECTRHYHQGCAKPKDR